MYIRAREAAKDGRSDEAVGLLERLVKSYKNTKTAVDAREALKRPSQNLPMFLDRPTVKAAAPPHAAAAPGLPRRRWSSPGRPRSRSRGTPRSSCRPTPPSRRLPDVAGDGRPRPPTPKPVDARPQAPRRLHRQARLGRVIDRLAARDRRRPRRRPDGVRPRRRLHDGRRQRRHFASPEHKVNLAGYYIDQHEVTVRQFRLFLAETHYPRTTPGQLVDSPTRPASPRPRTCRWSWSTRATRRPTPNGPANDLPTEAQWELAARSNDGRTLPLGQRARPLRASSRPSADRPGHVVPGRQVGLRRLRHVGERV